MKVLHLLDSLNHGGIELLELDLCRNAAANGLDLVFVTTSGGDLEPDFARAEVEFIRLQRRFPIDLHLVTELRRIIKARGVRVVHCHQAVDALHAYLATRGMQIARVLTFHGWLPSLKNRIAVKYLIPRMDINLATSNACLSMLAAFNFETAKNFRVLYNGVDAKRLKSDGHDLRAELEVKRTDLLLGMVGNFYVSMKDQITICKALPQVFSQLPNVHFAFGGGRSPTSPELFDDCVRFCESEGIAERVHFLGKLAQVSAFLKALDAFVFSSRQEGLPIAVIEAMMVGLPTIVSDIPPLLEVTGNGECALTFRCGDPGDLARQIITLVKNSEERARLGAQGRERALARFSIETHISNLQKLYSSLDDKR